MSLPPFLKTISHHLNYAKFPMVFPPLNKGGMAGGRVFTLCLTALLRLSTLRRWLLSVMLFSSCRILIMFMSQFPMTFLLAQMKIFLFIKLLLITLMLIRVIFVIMLEIVLEIGKDIFNLSTSVADTGWNWLIYPSQKVLGQASLISMIVTCLLKEPIAFQKDISHEF